MNPVAATGTSGKLLTYLESILLASPAWQSWSGGLAAAAAGLYLVAAPAGSNTVPRAIINHAGSHVQTRGDLVEGDDTQVAGVTLYLSAPTPIDQTATPPAAYSPRDAMVDFLNRIDAVISDVWAAKTMGGYNPVLLSVSLLSGPDRVQDTERDKYGDFISAIFVLEFRTWP